jgi:hypothetical protein
LPRQAFLEGTLEVSFTAFADDQERYAHIANVVRRWAMRACPSPTRASCCVIWRAPAATRARN